MPSKTPAAILVEIKDQNQYVEVRFVLNKLASRKQILEDIHKSLTELETCRLDGEIIPLLELFSYRESDNQLEDALELKRNNATLSWRRISQKIYGTPAKHSSLRQWYNRLSRVIENDK